MIDMIERGRKREREGERERGRRGGDRAGTTRARMQRQLKPAVATNGQSQQLQRMDSHSSCNEWTVTAVAAMELSIFQTNGKPTQGKALNRTLASLALSWARAWAATELESVSDLRAVSAAFTAVCCFLTSLRSSAASWVIMTHQSISPSQALHTTPLCRRASEERGHVPASGLRSARLATLPCQMRRLSSRPQRPSAPAHYCIAWCWDSF